MNEGLRLAVEPIQSASERSYPEDAIAVLIQAHDGVDGQTRRIVFAVGEVSEMHR